VGSSDQNAEAWALAVEGLSERQLLLIEQCKRRVLFMPRDILFHQGAPSTHLWIIEEGIARVFHANEHGRQFTSSVAGPDTVVGIVPMLLDRPHFLCAQSVRQTTAASLSRGALMALMGQMPRLATNLHHIVEGVAMESLLRNSRVADSMPARLAKALRDLVVRAGERAGGSAYVVRGLTHQDIATMVGASRTWVSLTLAAFERQGLLRRSKGALVIADVRKLSLFIAALERTCARSSLSVGASSYEHV
jgi:CRP-like cAMP-binding protein